MTINAERNTKEFHALEMARRRLMRESKQRRLSYTTDEMPINEQDFMSSRNLLHMIITDAPLEAPTSLQQDIDIVRSTVELLTEAVDNGTVSESEADKALEAIIQAFIARRVEEAVQSVTETPEERVSAFAMGVESYGERF